MKLSAAYVSLAYRLQESVGDLSATEARANLLKILLDEKEFPLIREAGARHSSSDMQLLQTIHDHAVGLGAGCAISEAAGAIEAAPLKLTESASTLEPIILREAKADYEIKLIAPGKGSSAFYPAEVLKRDGPKVFGAGTHVYLNHPTQAEESARPEGDVSNLAGVLTTTAQYHESHAKGPGLYARMKVFADHATMVEEKAAHVGMSIRASGNAESGKTRDGVPVLKELTSAESVDVVTRAGAGGMILTEAARSANPNEGGRVDMDQAEVTKLVETAVKAALAEAQKAPNTTIAALEARAIRGDAREEATRILSGVTLPEASKQRVIESALRDIPTKDGALDTVKFTEAVNAEAKREGAYVSTLTGGAQVRGLGLAAAAAVDPVKAREAEALQEADAKKLREASENVFFRLMGNKDAAKMAASKGVAA